MNRRIFIRQCGILSSILPVLAFDFKLVAFNGPFKRVYPSYSHFPEATFPEGKRVPSGWAVFKIPREGHSNGLLQFPAVASDTPVFLRLTAAIDFREEKRLTLCTGITQEPIGEWVMTFAHPYQPFEFEIPEQVLNKVQEEGIRIALSHGEDNAWFYEVDVHAPEAFQPHLLLGDSPGSMEDFFENLYSMNSFSPFGWMGGSVQDALLTLHLQGNEKASSTLHRHLEQYLDEDEGIRFESPHTVPLDGGFNSLEDFLPFAAIVALYPSHPSIDRALAFILKGRDEEGVIGGHHITTEGCYTLAYPLIAIGLQRNEDALVQLGLEQLEVRKKLLTDNEAIYQRATRDGQIGYRNWGRGAVWFLLGLIKSAYLLKGTPWSEEFENRNLKTAFVQLCGVMASHQDDQGMWRGYVDQPEHAVDTSATAGIAAAMVWGVNMGWLENRYMEISKKAADGLRIYLSPDGFLRGVSQINRGGEELQRSPYRVISQFGMGLFAQLIAAMEHSKGG